MHCNIWHNKIIMQYKFMRPALDLHNLHKQNSRRRKSLYNNIIIIIMVSRVAKYTLSSTIVHVVTNCKNPFGEWCIVLNNVPFCSMQVVYVYIHTYMYIHVCIGTYMYLYINWLEQWTCIPFHRIQVVYIYLQCTYTYTDHHVYMYHHIAFTGMH